MSLETRLKAALERVAAVIKQRGVPAGGTAGQVLTKASGSDYDAGWVTPAAGGGDGITFEEADGTPSIQATRLIVEGGELTQINPTTVKLKVTASSGSGGTMAAYNPKYQRTVSVTNPLPYRAALRISFMIRTAFAQSDGRDIQAFNAAGALIPTAVNNVVYGLNYADYYMTAVDTLEGSATQAYTVKYGDEYAPERQVFNDMLYRALNKLERAAGATSTIRLDNSLGFRSPDFLAPDNWVFTGSNGLSTLPQGASVSLDGVTTGNTQVIFSSMDSRIQLEPASGNKPAIFTGTDYSAALTPAQAGYGGGTITNSGACVVRHQLADGWSWDIRATGGSNSGPGGTGYGYHDVTVRYRAGFGWIWTLHNRVGTPNTSYVQNAKFNPNATSGAAVPFYNNGLLPLIGTISANDPSTWHVIAILDNNRVTATVGDETAT